MNNRLVFENPGAIDVRAICTFGVSAKDGQSPIGYFGTGLKYAIAILLRNKHRITIYSGLEVCEFGVRPAMIRMHEFQIVTMNGEPLGFTTDVGRDWKMWMCYREIFCNMLDEGGQVYRSAEPITPDAGKTFVVVDGPEFSKAHDSRGEYFVEATRPAVAGKRAEIYHGAAGGIFYRRLRVKDADAAFTYNILSRVELTEDRTAAWEFELKEAAASALLACDDREIIAAALTRPRNTFEHELDFKAPSEPPGAAFVQVVQELRETRIRDLNLTAVETVARHLAVALEPGLFECTEIEARVFDRAVLFAEMLGFQPRKYPIVFVEGLGDDVLAAAKGGKILLTRQIFDQGTKRVALALIEESIHLRKGYGDCTRSMQTYLLEQIVSLGELHVLKEPL